MNTIAADAVKKGCTMPAMVRGCPDGTLENPLNDGNWQTVTALLNDLKKAIINKTPYTYTKNLNLDTGSQVSIGKTCFDPIYYDYSSMTVNSKKVNTVSYTKDVTKSFGGGEYWTLNFDGQLWIKIPKVVQAGKDISKTKIDYLEQWLLCGKEEKEIAENTTYQPPKGAVDVSLLKTSILGKKMLQISEGCTATAPHKDRRKGYLYVDSKGYCTFGIGHLIRKGDCTEADETDWGEKNWDEAMDDFENGKLKEFEDIVKRNVKVPVTQEEFDAMVSFAFNVGEGNINDDNKKNDGFQGSMFIKDNLNKGIRNPDLMYNFKDNPNRRKSEVELFKTGQYLHYPGGEEISNLKIACDGK